MNNIKNHNDTEDFSLLSILSTIFVIYFILYMISDSGIKFVYFWGIIAFIAIFVVKKISAKILISILLFIYLSTGYSLNTEVKDSSTHGNTKHGWYSEKNKKEQFIAKSWFILFPLVSFAFIVFVYQEEFEKLNEKDEDEDDDSENEKGNTIDFLNSYNYTSR